MNDNYLKIKNIDQGAFGKVIMAKDKSTNETVAIKILNKKYKNWEECLNLREVKSLSKLRKLEHPNIIKLKEVYKKKIENELCLVFEYAEKNLFKLYTEEYKNLGKEIPESLIKTIIYQIASALSCIHKNGFFHRDIKPENILMNKNNVVKLADFGLAREIRSALPYTDYVGTRWYRSPDILLDSNNYNSPCDIFALGCIMAELYILKPLFNGINSLDQMNKIFQVLGTPSKDWIEGYKLANKKGIIFQKYNSINLSELIPNASSEGIDLIKKMLEYNNRKRIKAVDILKHPFFTNSMISPGNYNEINLLNSYPNLNNKPGYNAPKIKEEKVIKTFVKKDTDDWDDFNIEFTNNNNKKQDKQDNNIKNEYNNHFNDKDWDNEEDDWLDTKTYLKDNIKNTKNTYNSQINKNNSIGINNNISKSYFIKEPTTYNSKKQVGDKNLFDNPFLLENNNIYQKNDLISGINIFK